MFAYVRLELIRTVRDGGYVIIGIAMPVMMYLVFTNLGVAGHDRRYAAVYAMVSVAAFGAIGAAFNNGTGIAEDRGLSWLRQLRLTPLAPREVVAAKTITGMLVVLPSIVAVCLTGRLVNGVQLTAGQWVSILALLWLGAAPFALLGLGNGYFLTGQSAGMANLAASMSLAVVGGLWVPVTTFPDWLQRIAEWTPSNRYGELSWRIAFGDAPSLTGLGILAAWLAVFAAYAAFGYRTAGRTA